MLTRLKIENIAIIELADISFSEGFNVLTGETGAGKSIIIDSINAVTGERTSKELIRTGAQSASVTAVFEDAEDSVLQTLEQMGIEQDSTVVLTRTIKKDGKNICAINGSPASVSMLKAVGSQLINIHGQHDSQALLQPEKHCSFIDAFGKCENILDKYTQSYNELVKIKEEIKSISINEQEKARRTDILNFQIDELENADLRVGEIASLKERRKFLKNTKNIADALNAAYDALMADGAGLDSISNASYELDSAAELYDGLSSISQRISDARYEIEDCSSEIRSFIMQTECDPEELEEIEARLDFLHRLSVKYGADEEEMLNFLDNAKKELDSITLSDEKIQALLNRKAEVLEKTKALAETLSEKRKKQGKILSDLICGELKFLDMPNVSFGVSAKEKPLSPDGKDEIEFLISPNIGEEQKPLAKIASGGELSRIMLAIKNVISSSEGNYTMIFDEIDSGVSGSAAGKIAEKLKEVSGGRQVICVTHLAQIAALADCHILVKKYSDKEKTFTGVEFLDYDKRAQELARIMGNGSQSQAFIQSAKELLTGLKN